MKSAFLAGIAVVCVTHVAGADEVDPEPAPSSVGATGGRFAAPNGQLGAGLTFSPEQRGRVFAEMGFTHSSDEVSLLGVTVEAYVTSLSWIVGGGYKVTPNLELDIALPFAWATYGFNVSGGGAGNQSTDESGLAVGNLHLGLSYLHARDQLRLKVGGAVEYGPWTGDPEPESVVALSGGIAARGGQDIGLWYPEVLSIVTPARIEYGDKLVLGGDASLGLHIPTDSGDTELSIQLSPGIGYYVTDTVLVGGRVPFTLVPTENGDETTFLAVEPYARFDIGSAFLAARFTLNIDDPYGFSFDEGKIWGLHVGAGGSF